MQTINVLKNVEVNMINNIYFSPNEQYAVVEGYNGNTTFYNTNNPSYKKFFLRKGKINASAFNNKYYVGNINIDKYDSEFFIYDIEAEKVLYSCFLERVQGDKQKDKSIRSITFIDDRILFTLYNKTNFVLTVEEFYKGFKLSEYIDNVQTSFFDLKSACYNVKYVKHLNSLLIRTETTMHLHNLHTNNKIIINYPNIEGGKYSSENVKIIQNKIYCASSSSGVHIYEYSEHMNTITLINHYPIFNWGFMKESEFRTLIEDITINPLNNTVLFLLKGSTRNSSDNKVIEWNYRKQELMKERFTITLSKYKKINNIKIDENYSKLLLSNAKQVILFEGDLNF